MSDLCVFPSCVLHRVLPCIKCWRILVYVTDDLANHDNDTHLFPDHQPGTGNLYLRLFCVYDAILCNVWCRYHQACVVHMCGCAFLPRVYSSFSLLPCVFPSCVLHRVLPCIKCWRLFDKTTSVTTTQVMVNLLCFCPAFCFHCCAGCIGGVHCVLCTFVCACLHVCCVCAGMVPCTFLPLQSFLVRVALVYRLLLCAFVHVCLLRGGGGDKVGALVLRGLVLLS
jgi:hypothetical protein